MVDEAGAVVLERRVATDPTRIAACHAARRAKAQLALRPAKTDRNDARGLAEIARMGWYAKVCGRPSTPSSPHGARSRASTACCCALATPAVMPPANG